jgi:prophage regulatory protein
MKVNVPSPTSPVTSVKVGDRMLKLPEVKRITGLSRSTIYLRMSYGIFPKTVKLGERAVGWIESEILAWLEQRIVDSRRYA